MVLGLEPGLCFRSLLEYVSVAGAILDVQLHNGRMVLY